jgi:hypothetical protein
MGRMPRAPEFWGRQFGEPRTPSQLAFDIAFGLILPVLCLVFDPGVFGAFRLEACLFIGIEIAALGIWLALGSRLAGQASLISGTLYCGFAGAAVVGLMLLPMTLIGLFFVFVIAALGFIPFFTAIVFLRNAVRAGAVARTPHSRRHVVLATILGLLVTVAVASRIARSAPWNS